jgi:ligand-binding sensor domain-containing protein
MRLKHADNDNQSLSGNNVTDIIEDRTGVLWVGTSGSGLNKSIKKKAFGHYTDSVNTPYSVYLCHQDRAGKIWIGSVQGLEQFEPEFGRRLHQYDFHQLFPHAETCYCFAACEDNAGNLWIASSIGLLKHDSASGRFQRFHSRNSGLEVDYLKDIIRDHKGVLWISTYFGGLVRFDPASLEFQHLKHQPGVQSSLSDNTLLCVMEDQQYRIWVGTESQGLSCYNRTTGLFVHYKHDPDDERSLSADRILCVFQSRAGQIWAGTHHGGLNRLQTGTDTFEKVTVESGLPSNTVYSILEDHQGWLWMGTSQGLAKYHPHSRQVVTFDTDDGLQGPEFNIGAACLSKEGRMIIGGHNGFNFFYPDSIQSDTTLGTLVMTDFRIQNQSLEPGGIWQGRMVLQENIQCRPSLKLS